MKISLKMRFLPWVLLRQHSLTWNLVSRWILGLFPKNFGSGYPLKRQRSSSWNHENRSCSDEDTIDLVSVVEIDAENGRICPFQTIYLNEYFVFCPKNFGSASALKRRSPTKWNHENRSWFDGDTVDLVSAVESIRKIAIKKKKKRRCASHWKTTTLQSRSRLISQGSNDRCSDNKKVG